MRLRHIKNSENDIKTFPLYLDHQIHNTLNPITSNNVFNNNNPLYLELGMGKGKFITQNAIHNPDINYIGIEKYATVMLYAYKTYQKYAKENFNNLKMMCVDVKDLEQYFMPKNIDKIFLNFSDPWPKKRHENRRLTSKFFLDIYRKLLKTNATIEFKTDNLSLFEFSIESLKQNNYNILYTTYDLHNDKEANKSNIMTEYEEKFSQLDNKIYKLITTP